MATVLVTRTNYRPSRLAAGIALRTSPGIAPVIAALVVIVAILASSTAYLSLQTLQSSKPSTGGLGYSVVPVGSNGLSVGSSTGSSSPTNSITVVGAGQLTYIPNEALLGVSVVASNKTAQETTQTDAVTTAEVIKALNSIGISNSSIQTAGYNLSPNYSNCGYSGCVPSILSFTVTNSLLVNLTSSDARQLGLSVGKAIDTAVGAGANEVSLQFAATASLLSSMNAQALQEAVSSASAQAHTIASSLGVTISGVISASESYSYYPYYPQGFGGFVADVSGAPAQITPIMPGAQTISASVQVVYAIG